MRRKSFYLPSDEEEASINLTPLIDVVFVVLITFIVVAPLLEFEEIVLAPANGIIEEMHSVTKTSPVAILVKQDDTVWIGKHQVHLDNLEAELKRLKESQGNQPAQLLQDRRAKFGTYQMVKNAAERAGYSELELILQPA